MAARSGCGVSRAASLSPIKTSVLMTISWPIGRMIAVYTVPHLFRIAVLPANSRRAIQYRASVGEARFIQARIDRDHTNVGPVTIWRPKIANERRPRNAREPGPFYPLTARFEE